MRLRPALLFAAGLIVGALLSHERVVDAATALMYGSFGNTTKAITLTSTGAVRVQAN